MKTKAMFLQSPFSTRLMTTALAAGLLACSASAQIWDLNADFSETENPNGPWSFNEGPNVITVFQPDIQPVGGWSVPQSGWAWNPNDTPGTTSSLPIFFRSNGSETFFPDWVEGDIVVAATDTYNGVGHGNANITWTAPFDSDGPVSVSGNTWSGLEIPGRTTDWLLSLNGVIKASGSFPGANDAFTRDNPAGFGFAEPMVAGDVVKLEYITTSTFDDALGVNITIEAQPLPLCPCDSFTTTDFGPPMGKKKKLGSTLPVKFRLFHEGVEVLGREALDGILAAHGCASACPEIVVWELAADGSLSELPEDGIADNVGETEAGHCFRFSDGNWIYNLRLYNAFQSGNHYLVEVVLGDCLLTPGNNLFQVK